MQFYENGFYPGDPSLHPEAADRAGGSEAGISDEVDVLIVGGGPAGLVLAAQLAVFPGIVTRIVERKPGPLQLGQADGVACRSVEMFEAFGLSARLLEEAYWVNETVFWRPDHDDRSRITRSGRIYDTEDGLSEFPHVVINQARIHEYLLESMRKSPSRLEPDYGIEFVDLVRDDSDEYPLTATLRRIDEGDEGLFTVKAKFLVGCDGARSAVRQSIGRVLRGDSTNQAWGVMDVLAVTDFPDIRFKSVIQSGNGGNIVVIPREGGHLVRLYIELDELYPDERISARQMTSDRLIDAARRILHPFTLDVREVVWWSAYEIGQRVTDKFDDADDVDDAAIPRVFIAGDACHTHSPKAGQGMNVSMQDAFNLGWKLAAVLEGRSAPAMLHTYSAERQVVAQQLIDFDREWAEMFSAPPQDPSEPDASSVAPEVLQQHFMEQGRYTAGVATRYTPSLLIGASSANRLATGYPVGERFHSERVARVADGKPVELGHAARADGRWRIYAFADAADPRSEDSRLRALCDHLAHSPDSVLRRFGRANGALDAVIDVRGIIQQNYHDISVDELPSLLLPSTGTLGLHDYEKAFAPDARSGRDIFDLRGIDRRSGCMVVVRPDQYVAHVLALDAVEELTAFFAGFLVDTRSLSARS